jgi:signal transduction histidine kinase/DNA-binding response OmpR family regulator
MAILKVIQGLNPGQIFELAGPELTLGRHPNCEIVLSNSEVSRFHARLLHQPDGYFLEDLNSRNGTYVNGQRIEGRQRLADGDHLELSDVELTFLLGAPDRAAETLPLPKPAALPDAAPPAPPEGKPGSSSTVVSVLDAVTSPGQRVELNSASKLRAMLEITRSLGTSLAVDEVLPKILDTVFDLFPQAYRGYILLSEEPGPHLRPCVVKVRHDEPGSSITISPISQTIARRVMTEAKAILSTDAGNDERFARSESVIDLVMRCVMCAPLLGPAGKPLGIIHLDTQDSAQMFDEDDLDVLLSVAILAGQAVEYARMHSALLDLDRHKRESKELQEAKNAAEQANRAKSEFLANISHELRTPLNAVLGMTELALDEELPPPIRDYLTTAKDSADLLLGLLNEILDFSRLEAGKFVLEKTPYSLRHTLDDMMKTLAVRAYKKGLELICDLPGGIPDELVGDPLRLRQVLTNLVGNAIKFTEQGEIVVKASLESQTPHDVCLLFGVQDSGIGISPIDQKRIFAPFTQADASTTRHYGGTGLGLAIASNLIAMMGGRLWVDSQPGKGSTFWFTARFPRHLGPAVAPTLPASLLEALRGQPILVVDDNATSRQVLKSMLADWELQPESAADGPAALALLQQAADAGRKFPVIILDALMPGIDGLALAEQIQANPRTTCPIILMLSSADRQTFAKRYGQLQSAVILEKPISKHDLLHAVGEALGVIPALEATAPWAAGSSVAAPAIRPLRVLLAEDTPANRKFVVKILQKRGHAVEIAHNGREATELVRQQRFDVVLMDVQMPIMDGFQATAAIRAHYPAGEPHLPIVALTAHAMRGDHERCLAAGMDAYIAKPIDSRKLVELVEGLAAQHESGGD